MSNYIFRNEKGGYESAYDKNSLMKLCYEEIADLEAKLAEKEEKLYQANSRANELECNLELFNRCLIKNEEIINANNQDKISFCIEQLEKVKEKVFDFEYEDIFYFDKFIEYIDNQIEELKKGDE